MQCQIAEPEIRARYNASMQLKNEGNDHIKVRLLPIAIIGIATVRFRARVITKVKVTARVRVRVRVRVIVIVIVVRIIVELVMVIGTLGLHSALKHAVPGSEVLRGAGSVQ